jgi:hypothetical protein
MAVYQKSPWLVRTEDRLLSWEFSNGTHGLDSLLRVRKMAETVAECRDRDRPFQPQVRKDLEFINITIITIIVFLEN